MQHRGHLGANGAQHGGMQNGSAENGSVQNGLSGVGGSEWGWLRGPEGGVELGRLWHVQLAASQELAAACLPPTHRHDPGDTAAGLGQHVHSAGAAPAPPQAGLARMLHTAGLLASAVVAARAKPPHSPTPPVTPARPQTTPVFQPALSSSHTPAAFPCSLLVALHSCLSGALLLHHQETRLEEGVTAETLSRTKASLEELVRVCSCSCCHLPQPALLQQLRSHSPGGGQPLAHSLDGAQPRAPSSDGARTQALSTFGAQPQNNSPGSTQPREPWQDSPTMQFMYQHPPCPMHPTPWPSPPTFTNLLAPAATASPCCVEGPGQAGCPPSHFSSSSGSSSSRGSCPWDALAEAVCEQLLFNTGFVAAVVLGRVFGRVGVPDIVGIPDSSSHPSTLQPHTIDSSVDQHTHQQHRWQALDAEACAATHAILPEEQSSPGDVCFVFVSGQRLYAHAAVLAPCHPLMARLHKALQDSAGTRCTQPSDAYHELQHPCLLQQQQQQRQQQQGLSYSVQPSEEQDSLPAQAITIPMGSTVKPAVFRRLLDFLCTGCCTLPGGPDQAEAARSLLHMSAALHLPALTVLLTGSSSSSLGVAAAASAASAAAPHTRDSSSSSSRNGSSGAAKAGMKLTKLPKRPQLPHAADVLPPLPPYRACLLPQCAMPLYGSGVHGEVEECLGGQGEGAGGKENGHSSFSCSRMSDSQGVRDGMRIGTPMQQGHAGRGEQECGYMQGMRSEREEEEVSEEGHQCQLRHDLVYWVSSEGVLHLPRSIQQEQEEQQQQQQQQEQQHHHQQLLQQSLQLHPPLLPLLEASAAWYTSIASGLPRSVQCTVLLDGGAELGSSGSSDKGASLCMGSGKGGASLRAHSDAATSSSGCGCGHPRTTHTAHTAQHSELHELPQLDATHDLLVAVPPASLQRPEHAPARSGGRASLRCLLLPAHSLLLSAGGGEVIGAMCSGRWGGAECRPSAITAVANSPTPVRLPWQARKALDQQPEQQQQQQQQQRRHKQQQNGVSCQGLPPAQDSQCNGPQGRPQQGPSYVRSLPVITLPEVPDAEVGLAVCAYAYTRRLLLPHMRVCGPEFCVSEPSQHQEQQQQRQEHHHQQQQQQGICCVCHAARTSLRVYCCAEALMLEELQQLCRDAVLTALPHLPPPCLLTLALDGALLGLDWVHPEGVLSALSDWAFVRATGSSTHSLPTRKGPSLPPPLRLKGSPGVGKAAWLEELQGLAEWARLPEVLQAGIATEVAHLVHHKVAAACEGIE